MKSEITIKEIAKLSKCSMSTVSKSLKDSREISDRTKNRIKKIAKKYNYVTNNAASALRSKKTRIFALIVPQIESELYSSLISKIQEEAFKNNYRMLIMESFFCKEQELGCLNTIRDGCIDGIIIILKDKTKSYYLKNSCLNIACGSIMPVVIQAVNESSLNVLENKQIAEKSFSLLYDKINNLNGVN